MNTIELTLEKQSDNTLDNKVTQLFNATGLHQLDATLRTTMSVATLGLANFFYNWIDEKGISNRAHLDRYNEEHPNAPLHDPYTNTPAQTTATKKTNPYTLEA